MNPLDDAFLITIVTSAGALGVASAGIVDGLKVFRRIGQTGFGEIRKGLSPMWGTLERTYGDESEMLLRSQYVGDAEALVRSLRQGVRVGLTEENAACIAEFLGAVDSKTLVSAAGKKESGSTLSDEETNVLGRYELAVDARIDSALGLARDRYKARMRVAAMAVSEIIAILVAAGMALAGDGDEIAGSTGGLFLLAIVIGLIAVPLAPISHDVATAIREAAKALRARQS